MPLISITFDSLERFEFRTRVLPWLATNCMGKYTFRWPYQIVLFEHDEDASVALMAFNGRRTKSKIDQMIEHEVED